jgi:hypothetical protein
MKFSTLLAGTVFLLASSLQVVAQQGAASNDFNVGVAQPIKLTAITVNTRNHRRGKTGGSWLTEPLVQVENTSGKIIQYMVIEISLPDAKPTTSGPLMLAYGQPPGKSLPNVIEQLQPGKKVGLSIDGNACDTVKAHLLNSGIRLPAGSRVSTRINAVVFANGTAWFDGLLHVADPKDSRRWLVAKNLDHAGLFNNGPLFSFMPATFRPKTELCWDRIGTEWVDCCPGLQIASAIMVQVFGGVFEPFPMLHECGDGTFCEWIKQLQCSHIPPGPAY